MQINIRENTSDLIKYFERINKKIMPEVITDALNRTAYKIRTEHKKEMERIFDRPTRFTLNSIFVKPAKKNMAEIFAQVDFIGHAYKGTPAGRYLLPHIEGGPRKLKGFEVRLKSQGILPNGHFITPGRAAKLNASGNISQGLIQQVLSFFGSQRDDAQNTKFGTGRRQQKSKFVLLPARNGKAGGIWRSGKGNQLLPIMTFVKNPTYKKIYALDQITDRIYRDNIARYLTDSFDKAIARSAKA